MVGESLLQVLVCELVEVEGGGKYEEEGDEKILKLLSSIKRRESVRYSESLAVRIRNK